VVFDELNGFGCAVLAVPESVIHVHSFGTAVIVVDGHIDVRKVRNPIPAASGHESAVVGSPAVRIM
jgi:hypothetical protein